MSEELEAVLRRVAAGELTPEQALHELGGKPAPPPRAEAAPPAEPTGPLEDDEPITTIRLKTSYRSVQVLTDPTVAQLHVQGKHEIRRDGSTLVVTTAGPLDDDESAPGDHARVPSGGRFSFNDLPRTVAWARSWRDHQLTVRVNPALAVELDVTGTDLKLSGLSAGLRAHLVASSLKAEKMRCQVNIESISSSVKLTAIPTGDSRLYCESSSVRLSLPAGSDLTISASNRMGRLALPDLPVSTLPFEGETSEVTIGAGRDRLTVEAVMSSVSVSAQAWGGAPV